MHLDRGGELALPHCLLSVEVVAARRQLEALEEPAVLRRRSVEHVLAFVNRTLVRACLALALGVRLARRRPAEELARARLRSRLLALALALEGRAVDEHNLCARLGRLGRVRGRSRGRCGGCAREVRQEGARGGLARRGGRALERLRLERLRRRGERQRGPSKNGRSAGPTAEVEGRESGTRSTISSLVRGSIRPSAMPRAKSPSRSLSKSRYSYVSMLHRCAIG